MIILLFIFITFSSAFSDPVCSFENEIVKLTWGVNNGNLSIVFQHNKLRDGRWTALAFGNGPGMTMLESIIISRKDNEIRVRTGYTPKYKKVIYDRESYVTVVEKDINGDVLKIAISRPLGEAGPRNFSLDRCINWNIVPGGGLLEDHQLEKHHGGAYKIENVCAADCTLKTMLLTNRIQ